jgi:enoyl-CoA hydratase/carnithine racemase
MSERNLLFEREASIATITMNRPEKRNPLSFETMTEMISLLRDIGSSREVRAVILAGKGPAYCAGQSFVAVMSRSTAVNLIFVPN